MSMPKPSNISNLVFCPYCDHELRGAEQNQSRCGYCGESLRRLSSNSLFRLPEYLYTQKQRILDDDERDVETDDVDAAHRELVTSSFIEDHYAAMNDAYFYLSHVLHMRNISPTDLRSLLSLGKKIGALATTIESYIVNGGFLNEPRRTPKIPTNKEPSDFS